MSQLALALQLGVSQRHISFVESGRARPSRELLMAWLQTLEAPLAQSNAVLLAAGYAPAYSEGRLSEPWLAEAYHALEQLLAAHEPAPALVLDADWNVLRMNQGALWLATTLMPAAVPLLTQGSVNMLDLLTSPAGLASSVTNLAEVGPRFLTMLRHEAATHPALWPRVSAYEQYLQTHLGKSAKVALSARPQAPLLTTRFASPHGELAFFSMFSTFGTPNDITLASLRVEHMFPADEKTRSALSMAHARPHSLAAQITA